MTKILDACGLACPAPVLLVKDAIYKERPESLSVLVDNDASKENVTRFLNSANYQVSESQENGVFTLSAQDEGAGESTAPESSPSAGEEEQKKIMVVVASDRFGSGDDVLGGKLMINYLKTIKEMGDELWQLVFVNGGVKLTIDDSPVLQEIKEYEDTGVIVLACGTCLEHFGLMDRKQVGQTTNMLDIVTGMQLADKVINLG